MVSEENKKKRRRRSSEWFMKVQKEKKHWMPQMVSMPEIYIFEIPSCATWKFMNSLESKQKLRFIYSHRRRHHPPATFTFFSPLSSSLFLVNLLQWKEKKHNKSHLLKLSLHYVAFCVYWLIFHYFSHLLLAQHWIRQRDFFIKSNGLGLLPVLCCENQ